MYLKTDIFLLKKFQNYIDTCKSAYDINPLCSYSTPSFTWKAGLNYTGVQIDFITGDKLRILLDKNLRGRPSFCMGNCHVKRGDRKVVYEDMNNLYGWRVSQYLLTGVFNGIEIKKRNEAAKAPFGSVHSIIERKLIKTFLRTPDSSKCEYLLQCDSETSSNIHHQKKTLANSCR